MGVSEDEARRLILLAERDMLRVLKNDLRELVREVLEEEKEEIMKDLRSDVARAVEMEVKFAQRKMYEYLREEVQKALADLRSLEDRVLVLEKKYLDIEEKLGRVQEKAGRKKRMGIFIALIGAAIAITAVFVPDQTVRVVGAALGVLLLVGGVLFG